jgi:hypothetical protein
MMLFSLDNSLVVLCGDVTCFGVWALVSGGCVELMLIRLAGHSGNWPMAGHGRSDGPRPAWHAALWDRRCESLESAFLRGRVGISRNHCAGSVWSLAHSMNWNICLGPVIRQAELIQGHPAVSNSCPVRPRCTVSNHISLLGWLLLWNLRCPLSPRQ